MCQTAQARREEGQLHQAWATAEKSTCDTLFRPVHVRARREIPQGQLHQAWATAEKSTCDTLFRPVHVRARREIPQGQLHQAWATAEKSNAISVEEFPGRNKPRGVPPYIILEVQCQPPGIPSRQIMSAWRSLRGGRGGCSLWGKESKLAEQD